MSNSFGAFSSDGWEYRITTAETPRRWMNYFGGDSYGVCLAGDGTGYSVNTPPEGSKVTAPSGGRFVYLRDEKEGTLWSVTKEPARADFEQYECRHGVGYSEFRSRYTGIEASLLVFVPLGQSGECWRFTVKNMSERRRTVQIFPYAEWDLSAYLLPWDAALNYSHCKYIKKNATIVCALDDPLYPQLRHEGTFAASETPIGWECGKSAFLGPEGDLRNPRAVREMHCTNAPASTEICAAAMQFRVTLDPGEEKRLNFTLSYTRKPSGAEPFSRAFLENGHMDQAFGEMTDYWREKFSAVQVKTPDGNLDRLVNIWLKHQVYQANLWCRAGGCRGYRDTLQDASGVVSFDCDKARRQIRRALRHQYADGYAPRQFAENGGPHDVRLYSDNPVWIPLALCRYLTHSGDYDFLKEQLPFLSNGMRDTGFQHAVRQVTEFLTCDEKSTADVLEHTVRAMDYLWNTRGANGLCLMLGGDWNDALNGVGRKGKGESVWLSMIFADAMRQMEALCGHIDRPELSALYRARREELIRRINESAWDGKWYLRAFNDDGKKIGTAADEYGQIYILSQSWSIISGTADAQRMQTVLRSVRERLETPFGYLTMSPAYPAYDADVGRISILRPGTYENSSVYCHASAWQLLAELMAGNADAAYELFLKMVPTNPKHPPEVSFSEPYVFPNCYFGKETGARYGQSVMGWLTATASWIYQILTEWMLGIRPEHGGVRIDPRLPSGWNDVFISQRIRGCVYDITIRRAGGGEEAGLLVDGKPVEGGVVPYLADGSRHSVEAVIA